MKRTLSVLVCASIIIFAYAFTSHCTINDKLKKDSEADKYVKDAVYKEGGSINYSYINISKDILTAEVTGYYYWMNKEYVNSLERSFRNTTYNDIYQLLCDNLRSLANARYSDINSKKRINNVFITYDKKIVHQETYKKRYIKPVK